MSAEGVRRPIQIEEFKQAIKELASGELDRIQREIENNIRHLTRSNQRLLAYIDKIEGKVSKDNVDEIEELDNVDASDLGLFKESLLENQLVLNNNQERIAALEQEKIFRTSGMASAAVESSASKTPVVEDAPQTSLYL
ncbi:Tma17 protein [Maudiozyma humilis]|uniref:Tma17 protein n=1 Tax=Maudiozyma humilis TaxID=51915 RepID=A0AAV5RQ54_MAUHU|nr:Tma17 protein [Kazachstania humilis]